MEEVKALRLRLFSYYALGKPFFIRERDDDPASTYLCFDPQMDVKAHAQTLELNVVSLKFRVFNGL